MPSLQRTALQGRGSDTMLGHLTPGEMIVPQRMQTPQVMSALQDAFATKNRNLLTFTAGSPYQQINPTTGVAQFQDDPDELEDQQNLQNDEAGENAPISYPTPAQEDQVIPARYSAPAPQAQPAAAPAQPVAQPAAQVQPIPPARPQQGQQPSNLALPDNAFAGPAYSPAPPPGAAVKEAQKPGVMEALERGLLRAGEDVSQTAQAASGGTPTQSQTPQADYEQPLGWGDLTDPHMIAAKTMYGLARSSPTLGGALAGAGTMAAIPGLGETGLPEIGGAAAGAALGSAVSTLGPIYADQLKQNPNDPGAAWDAAVKQATTTGAISGVSQAVFEVPIFNSAIKQLVTQAFVAQPAVQIAGKAVTNVEQGKPATEGLGAEYPGAVVSTLVPGAAHVAGRAAGILPGGGGTPDQGPVDAASKAALDQTQPQQPQAPLALPPPSDANRPQLPPPAPTGTPPSPEAPTIPVPPQGPAQVSPMRYPPGAPIDVPPEAGQTQPPGTQGELPGVPPAPAQAELPLRQPAPAAPAGQLPEQQPQLPLGQEQPGLPFKLADQTNWNVQPDDQTPGQYVVKSGNDVLSVGSSPEEAVQFAQARAAAAMGQAPREPGTAVAPAEAAPSATPVSDQLALPGQGQQPLALPAPPERLLLPPAGRTPPEVITAGGPTLPEGTNVPERLVAEGPATPAAPADEPAAAGASGPTTVVGPEEPIPATVGQRLRKAQAQKAARQAAPEAPAAAEAPAPVETKGAQLRAKQRARMAPQEAPAPEGFVAPPTEAAPAPAATIGLMRRQSRMAEEARAEVEGQPQVFEPPAGQRAEVTEAGASPAEMTESLGKRAATTPEEATPGKPAEGSAAKRVAAHFMKQVLSGDMTAEEADKAYGSRPRSDYPRFTDYVQRALGEANDPSLREDLIKAAGRLQQAQREGDLSGPKMAGLNKAINAMVTHQNFLLDNTEGMSRIIDTLHGTGEAAAEGDNAAAAARARIRARAAEVRAAKPDEGETLGAEPGTTGALGRLGSALSRLVAGRAMAEDYAHFTPGINEPVARLLRSSTPRPLGEYLDSIINNQTARSVVPHSVELARQLKRLARVSGADTDTRVYNEDAAQRAFGIPYDNSAGSYLSGDRDAILLNRRRLEDGTVNAHENHTQAVLHEALHAVTAKYIAHLRDTPEAGLTPEQVRHSKAMVEIMREISRVADNYPQNSAVGRALRYAVSNPHEVITQVFTQPAAYRALAEAPASARLKSRLAALGMGPLGKAASVWDGFKSLVRSALRIKSDDSVLDHLMRPLSEMTEAGANFRRMNDIASRAERPGDEQVVSTAVNKMGMDTPLGAQPGRAREILEATFPRGRVVQNAVSRLAGYAMPFDAIERWNRSLFDSRDPADPRNSLTDFRDAREATTKNVNAERKNYSERVEDMQTSLKRDKEGLGDLMNDATVAEARLGDVNPRANAHLLTTEDGRQTLAALQERYNNLSPGAQRSYGQLRDLYREWYNKERQAEIDDVLARALPETTPEQRETINNQLRTREGIEQLVRDPDATPVAQAFGERWQNNRALMQEMGRIQRHGFVRGDYFPLRRYGDYVIRYGERGAPDYGVEMFERSAEAESRKADLEAQGVDVSPVFNKAQADPRQMLPEGSLDRMDAALDRTGMSNDTRQQVRDAIAGMMLRNATRSTMRRMNMRREGVAGASTDHARTLSNEFLSYTSRIGNLATRSAQLDAMRRMEAHVRDLRSPGQKEILRPDGTTYKLPPVSSADAQRAQIVLDNANRRLAPVDLDNASALVGRAARGMTNTSFITSLMRPAHLAVQFLDASSNGTSLMGGRHGFGASSLALSRAMRQLAGTAASATGRNIAKAMGNELRMNDWNLARLYQDRMIKSGMNEDHANRLMTSLNSAGLIDHTAIREIQRMAQRPGVLSRFDLGDNKLLSVPNNIMNMFAAGEHGVDSMMKTAIAKAAFDLELRRNGGNVDGAVQYATDMARSAMPNYNLHNKPLGAMMGGPLGPLAGPITQYKLYGLHMYGLMANLAKEAYERGGRERTEALKSLGAILLSHAALSGVTASIFGGLPMMLGMGFYDWLTGEKEPHTNADMEMAVRNWMAGNVGKTASEVFARGLPTLAGVDLHRSLKLSNAIDLPELKSFSSGDMLGALATALTGAAGETSVDMIDGLHRAISGDLGGLTRMLPRIVGDPLQAAQWYRTGVTSAKGEQVLPAEAITPYDVATKSLGFNPADVAMAREARQAEVLVRDEISEARSNAINGLISADPDDRADAYQQIYRYNATHPTYPITPQEIRQAWQSRLKQANQPGTYGLRIPKREIPAISGAGAFAQ